MKIMMREANDPFYAFLIAEAMESVGVEVFSITYDGEHKRVGALIPSSRLIVWGKASDNKQICAADEAFNSAIDASKGEPK